MINPINHPVLILVLSFAVPAFSVSFVGFLRRRRTQESAARETGVVETATLTLLALIAAFTFSMAIDRFGAVEANAIGTEYLRLPIPGIHSWHRDLIHVRANLDALATSLHAPS